MKRSIIYERKSMIGSNNWFSKTDQLVMIKNRFLIGITTCFTSEAIVTPIFICWEKLKTKVPQWILMRNNWWRKQVQTLIHNCIYLPLYNWLQWESILTSFVSCSKAGYTLIVSRVSTCSCTILWDCEPITIHFSQYRRFCSFLILWEIWRETFPISSLTLRENTDCLTRTAKREMRKMIGEMVYKMSSIHLSFLPFRQHFFAISSIWR